MKNYPFDRRLSNECDVLDYFIDAIHYRNSHKAESADIAEYAYNATHPQIRLHFPISANTDRLHDELGALEAPGMPEDDDKDPEEYDDEAWQRLLGLVEKKTDRLKNYPILG